MIPLVLEMLASSPGIGPSIAFALTSSPYAKVFYDTGAEPYVEATNYLSANPGSSFALVARFSPVGDVLAVGTSTSPYIHFYDNGAKLNNPASLPAASVSGLAWSNDGIYCAVGGGTPCIYKRSGVFTKLTSPFDVAPPSGTGTRCAFSDDGVYLAFVGSTSPYIAWYKRDGDSFTKLSNPTLPSGTGNQCAWAPDGAYLAVAHNGGTNLKVYKRTGDTLSVSGVSLPTITGNGKTVSWSADGNYLAVGTDAAPRFLVLKRSGDTFTKLADPADLPTTSVDAGLSFSGSNRIALTAQSNAIWVYTLESDVLTKASSSDLPTSGAICISFNPPAVPGSP
jgi:WD40 repeat protein